MGRQTTVGIGALVLCSVLAFSPGRGSRFACEQDNGGIVLPSGLCASIFADSVGPARHLAVARNGDVLVSIQGNQRGGAATAGVLLLRDADKDGRAEQRSQFASGFNSSDVALFDNYLYVETPTAILRYPYKDGQLVAESGPDTVAMSLPGGGGHPRKTFAITRDGAMYVNFGSTGNVCPPSGRGQPGADPCPELRTRAGIWRFDARKLRQTPADGEHYAIGVRNSIAIAVHPADQALWVAQHGRDELKLWPGYTPELSAELPSEELFRIERGGDYGWPYCYYDHIQKKKMLAPEYGGTGKEQGRCETLKSNVAAYPGHWAPNGLLFYTGSMLPEKYRNGVFIAFHGSWNRAPLPQQGFKVVFQPLRDNKTAAGDFEVFADGFTPNPGGGRGNAGHRPVGLAQGQDGALYITDDARGRIWKVVRAGGR
jgi:glucose/arabinose dehydrogenase